MKKTKVVKELENILVDSKSDIDNLYYFYKLVCLFDNIEDLKLYLIKEHDLCVDAYNFGVDRLERLCNESTIKGENNGKL